MSRLKPYHDKRHFGKTSEPHGTENPEAGRSYVVQEHHATNLHWDFRLEHKGVLLSWAVPKHPSLDPKVKRLAVHVEDHPVEYGGFEGQIPKGEYGGGTVKIWDKGTWSPYGDVDEMMRTGTMKFEVFGEKLKGDWALIQIKDDPKNWLLIKERDGYARIESLPSPEAFRPQLAEIGKAVPTGKNWIHEIKFDGYRIIAWSSNGEVRLFTRSGLDWTDRFKSIAKAIGTLHERSFVLDGEIVVLDEKGRSTFSGLQEWLKTGKGEKPIYYAFDLIAHMGDDITKLTTLERKEKLSKLIKSMQLNLIQYSEHIATDGQVLLEHACALGLEGIISKRGDQPYHQFRSSDWIKSKCVLEDEFIVGGFTKPTGERIGLGALLVGEFDEAGNLNYCGKVGTGFSDATLNDLYKKLEAIQQSDSPFAKHETPLPRGATWVRPILIAQIKYGERTPTGALRHPVFLGLREDKEISEMKELAVKLTSPERVIFPEHNITKKDLADYYARVSERMLPFIEERPLALVRCPEGIAKECFFQKHATAGMTPSMTRQTGKDDESVIAVANEFELLTLIQLGVIEIHPWGSRMGAVEAPDTLVFDLDPGPGVAWGTVIQAAQVMGELVRTFDLVPFVKTSGGKGFHVVVPIKAKSVSWDDHKTFAHNVSIALEKAVPKQFVTVMSKAKRNNRIFLDYLRNGRGSTSVAPYSVRTKPGAPVSLPIAWDRIQIVASGEDFSVLNCSDWIKEPDPWKDFYSSAKPVSAKMLDKAKKLAEA